MFQTISSGLLTTQFPGDLKKSLSIILNAILNEKESFSSKGDTFPFLQTEKGGRESILFPGIGKNEIPEFDSKEANFELKKILNFKNMVSDMLIRDHQHLKGQEYNQSVSFHMYKKNEGVELGFTPHIDFGMFAIVFTMGKDFQYSEDNGKTWKRLSDNSCVDSNTVIINFGRIYSTFTGFDPVYHRVSASDTLSNEGFSELSKFTIGFFQELVSSTVIPNVIPKNINGKHKQNWNFLINNCKIIGDYSRGREKGEIEESEDGLLFQKK